MRISRRPKARRGEHGLFFNSASLLICGLLTGVLVAAVAFPLVAVPGLVAKAGSDGFDSLPTELTVSQLPQISYLYASDGKTLITTFYDENRRDVKLTEVAPVMREAMVAAEDIRFYEHHGVDVKGVVRAFVANQQSSDVQGASTLTMQYVRLALEYSANTPQAAVDATTNTATRKVREMHYALAVEKQLTKDQILERYLNMAPFGDGAYGIYAAAEVFFGKTPDKLTLGEAALLAGLVKAPSSYAPSTADGLREALDRRDNHVLTNMVKMGYITNAEREATIKEKLNLVNKATPNSCASTAQNNWGFFCDIFYRWWLEQPAFGADQYERAERLKSGGYTIVTSLDVKAQTAAKKNVEKYDKTGNPTALILAGVEPNTGRIKLAATNRTYSNDQAHNKSNTNPDKRGKKGNYPNTTNPLVSGGGDINGYQFGSSFKVFTAVAALEHGIPLDYTVNTTSPYISKYIIDPGSPAACNGPYYCPVNDNPSWMNGPRNMWTGLGRSVNTYWVPVEWTVGAQNAVNAAESMGIKFRSGQDAKLAKSADQWGAFTLGVSASTPLDMANAYATLAADGNYCEPLPVVSIKDLRGNSLAAANPRCHRAVPVDVARGAIDAMRCPIGDQSAYGMCDGATAANIRGIVGKPTAGKTGTTDGDMTAALIATTKQMTVAGAVVDPDWAKTTRLRANLGGRDPHKDVVNLAVAHTLHDAMVGKASLNFTAPSPQMAWGPSGRRPAPPKPSNPAKPTRPGQGGPPIVFPPTRRH